MEVSLKMEQEPRSKTIKIVETRRTIFIEHTLCNIINLPNWNIMEMKRNDKKAEDNHGKSKKEIITIKSWKY